MLDCASSEPEISILRLFCRVFVCTLPEIEAEPSFIMDWAIASFLTVRVPVFVSSFVLREPAAVRVLVLENLSEAVTLPSICAVPWFVIFFPRIEPVTSRIWELRRLP